MGAGASPHDPLSPSRRRIYDVVNYSSTPMWLAMILAPRARATRWLVGRAPALWIGLGVAYDGLLAAGMINAGKSLDFRDPDAVRAALGTAETFLAGWTHYIAFDLFVGRWIWEDSLERNRHARLAMFLTWMGGPAGLSMYLLQRRRP